ncbi:MAG: 1-deoxy-D-xylulose-5-phosphate reductoisomerase [bacterium]
MKKILILGSTGSIGVNALDVIRQHPGDFMVSGLTANENIDLLEQQIKEFSPAAVAVKDGSKAKELKKRTNGKIEIFTGSEGLIKITKSIDYDILLSSLVGFAGLAPTIEGIKSKKRIALANKETLVVAGQLIIELCREYDVKILPVDSEHSAIFQCLVGEEKKNINRIILTASGGPFLSKSIEELEKVTIEDALNHPNWKMGNKITIDSATMMNKGLEVIEAHWLFGLPHEKLEVVVHPQSVIHSMVEFIDGSIKAQLSMPDMRLPIQYAFTYPERFNCNFVTTDFFKIGQLTFLQPDLKKFRCLDLAYEAMDCGGTAPCVLNAANEIAVEKFLNGEINFPGIPVIIEKALNKIVHTQNLDLETIYECDRITRDYVNKIFN